ncbi:MAG: helix-turn-helix transcriptional regulator [Pandoraea sp.]|nr:helix-turn-helix transcriptional regulator [Pandoraea sp.]MDR3400107.1 helix-turn-helix transcriptional regulator [Pandoraea sp.]
MSALIHRLGSTIRQLRESRGWSQEQLAEHASLNRSYVGELERGAAIASIVTVDKIASAFGIPIGQLVSADDVPVQPGVAPGASPSTYPTTVPTT